MWDLPRPGIKAMSPALAGRFLTTGPSGKSLQSGIKKKKEKKERDNDVQFIRMLGGLHMITIMKEICSYQQVASASLIFISYYTYFPPPAFQKLSALPVNLTSRKGSTLIHLESLNWCFTFTGGILFWNHRSELWIRALMMKKGFSLRHFRSQEEYRFVCFVFFPKSP